MIRVLVKRIDPRSILDTNRRRSIARERNFVFKALTLAAQL
jgi:hypothetical protein